MFLTRLFATIFLTTVSSAGFSQQFLKADGKKIMNGKAEIILKGVGLGGWMLQEPYMLKLSNVAVAQYDIRRKITELTGEANANEFYKAWLSNHCKKADIDSLAKWGFNSVRLPMHYNLYTLPVVAEKTAGENTWLQTGFELTDSLLSWCKANRIYLILDLHAAPGGQGNDNAISDRDTSQPSLWQSEPNRLKTIAFWKKLAERYKDEPWIGGYDILNEPNWGFQNASDKNGCAENGNAPLKKLFEDITAAIRTVDRNHLIIIEGNCWGNNYKGMFPLWDKNMALSFHKYWNFTNQASIQTFLDYRETYNVPIWLGETGENSNAWFTDAIELMEKNHIGWNMWPLKKSGNNNPLQINVNPGFQDIINYWEGKAAKPAREVAVNSLLEYARNTAIAENIIQPAVVYAMTGNKNQTIPFKTHVAAPGQIVFAADYDIGRSGLAYHDTDSANYWVSTTTRTQWNEGGAYRNDGVDIQSCTDSVSNGFSVGWIADGEWLQYSLFAANDVVLDVDVRTAVEKVPAEIKLLCNNSTSETELLPVTGSFNKWQTNTIRSIRLSKGWNSLKILAVKGGFNFNYLQFSIPTNTSTN